MMPDKFNGSLLGDRPTVTSSTASGIFNLNRQAESNRDGQWPAKKIANILVIAGGGGGGSSNFTPSSDGRGAGGGGAGG